MTFIFLHGFLGQPSDWSLSQTILRQRFPEARFVTPNLWTERALSSAVSLAAWGQSFCFWLEQLALPKPWRIYGYSLGGRLALQALAVGGEAFSEAYLLSTGLGLSSPQEQALRWAVDQNWSERFRRVKSELEFQNLLKDWNAQSVFVGEVVEPQRQWEDFDMLLLAQALENWSIAKQQDFAQALPKVPITWVVGELDVKYCQQARTRLTQQRVIYLKDCGHRLLFAAPWRDFLTGSS